MAQLFNSSGKAFTHPLTRQIVQPDEWYNGPANLPHEEGQNEPEPEPEEDEEPETFVCDGCGKGYQSKSGLNKHQKACEEYLALQEQDPPADDQNQ